jgi:hypothetical protein
MIFLSKNYLFRHIVDEQVLLDHFEKLGVEIIEAKISRNYYSSLEKYLEITEIRKEIKIEESEV